jgi:hypothetical protein
MFEHFKIVGIVENEFARNKAQKYFYYKVLKLNTVFYKIAKKEKEL